MNDDTIDTRDDERQRELEQSVDLDIEGLARTVPPEERPTFSMALAIIGQDAKPEDLELFVAGLPAPLIPWFVMRLKAIEKVAGDVADKLETEWGIRAGGLSWHNDETGDWFDYKASSRGGFKEIPDLVSQLERQGITTADIARAISGIRVTDLEATADELVAKIGHCQACGEYVPLEELYGGGHAISAHANDESCRADRHANCPVQELCGPVDEVPKGEYVRMIIRDHYAYTSGPKHLTKREPKPTRRGRPQKET